MNINNSFPSKWLKSGDIEDGTDLVLTIKAVEIETVGQGEDAEEKPVIYFNETEKGLVLNKTNAATIAALYTPETDNWTGKKVALFSTEVPFGSKMTVALRVRTKAPKASAHTYTLEQAVAALANAGVTKEQLKAALPKNEAGKAVYSPERDTALVNKLIGDAIAAGASAEAEL